MALTPEQFNKLAMKEDLKNLATKAEMNEMFYEVLSATDAMIKKIDNIDY